MCWYSVAALRTVVVWYITKHCCEQRRFRCFHFKLDAIVLTDVKIERTSNKSNHTRYTKNKTIENANFQLILQKMVFHATKLQHSISPNNWASSYENECLYGLYTWGRCDLYEIYHIVFVNWFETTRWTKIGKLYDLDNNVFAHQTCRYFTWINEMFSSFDTMYITKTLTLANVNP